MIDDQGTKEWDLAHKTVYLADGFYAVLWCIKADLDFMWSFYGWPRGNSATPCALCPCTLRADDCPWSDFRSPGSEWMTRIYGGDQWLGLNPPDQRQPLLTLPGVTILSMAVDWMHCKYLGTDQYFLGSVLFLMVYHLLPGRHMCRRKCKVLYGKHFAQSKAAVLT